MVINPELYDKISFPDCSVKTISYDLENKILVVKIDGIYIENFITGQTKECVITVTQWNKFEILEYHNDKYKKLKISNIDLLKDICESKIGSDQLVLKGFGKLSGHWIEYHLSKPNIKIETFD